MNDLISFKENLKDSMTNSLLDYINYLHETKKNIDTLENGNDALAKCEIMCGELFSSKIKKGEVTQSDIESFESFLPTEEILIHKNKDLDLANKIIKEENAMAFNEYMSKFGTTNKKIGQKVA